MGEFLFCYNERRKIIVELLTALLRDDIIFRRQIVQALAHPLAMRRRSRCVALIAFCNGARRNFSSGRSSEKSDSTRHFGRARRHTMHMQQHTAQLDTLCILMGAENENEKKNSSLLSGHHAATKGHSLATGGQKKAKRAESKDVILCIKA
jgi:hypothetical protein